MQELPQPDQDALNLSHQLQNKIRDKIFAENGSISFATFMEMALYEPGLGYYSAGSAKFGSAGDFVTSPEVSSLFGECLAQQTAQILNELKEKNVLEFGAGSGRLVCDMLDALEALNSLPDRYLILEVSADLRDRQRQLIAEEIPHLLERVVWLDALPKKPIHAVVIANEILDAMPVQRFQISTKGVQEQCVAFDGEKFHYTLEPASAQLTEAIQSLQIDLPLGYTSEINLNLANWFTGIANALSSGVIFCVDYGYSQREYYHAEQINGTLICHYRHRCHDDPFFAIGLQDLSASVDFTHTAETAFCGGLSVAGFTTQTFFLMSCGLTALLEDKKEQSPEHYLRFSQQAKTLILPDEMGERFKVIGLTKNFNKPLLGFEMNNMLDRL